jgi:hypothetical protein
VPLAVIFYDLGPLCRHTKGNLASYKWEVNCNEGLNIFSIVHAFTSSTFELEVYVLPQSCWQILPRPQLKMTTFRTKLVQYRLSKLVFDTISIMATANHRHFVVAGSNDNVISVLTQEGAHLLIRYPLARRLKGGVALLQTGPSRVVVQTIDGTNSQVRSRYLTDVLLVRKSTRCVLADEIRPTFV